MHQALVTWFGHDKAHQSISHLLSSVRAGSDRAKAVGWLLRDPLLNLSQHFAVLHDCLKSPPVLLSCWQELRPVSYHFKTGPEAKLARPWALAPGFKMMVGS